MNPSKGKGACMQVRVCISVCQAQCPHVYLTTNVQMSVHVDKHFLVCVSVNAGAIYLHYAPLSSHKEAGNEAGI